MRTLTQSSGTLQVYSLIYIILIQFTFFISIYNIQIILQINTDDTKNTEIKRNVTFAVKKKGVIELRWPQIRGYGATTGSKY
jgi:hypothetical protein